MAPPLDDLGLDLVGEPLGLGDVEANRDPGWHLRFDGIWDEKTWNKKKMQKSDEVKVKFSLRATYLLS